MLSTVSNVMWQTQEFLHKKPQAVPGMLLSVAGVCLIHRHMTSDVEHEEQDHIKTFLALIIIQMLPLVALEMKIMSCADPVGLFCKFATPVTLVHAIFLTMRLCMWNLYETTYLICSGLGLIAALITLSKGFKESLRSIISRGDVWLLVGIAVAAAFATNSIDSYVNPPPAWRAQSWGDFFDAMLSTSNSYIELMGFVPAVWMVYRQDQRTYDDIDSVSTKRKATAFFLFLVSFYLMEDVMQAWDSLFVAPCAACAHMVHFMLLGDFAFYVLAHIYNTDKLVGQLRKWLPADVSCDV